MLNWDYRPEEAYCNDSIWGKLVTGHTTDTIGVVYRYPDITKQNNEKIHNTISEVSKGDCIIMGDFNHGNIEWDTQQSIGVEDQAFVCMIQENFLILTIITNQSSEDIIYYSVVFTKLVFTKIIY